jgi:hypothetical protein
MPRIETDPNLQVCPDFASDDFAAIRDTIIATTHSSHEEVAASLTASWGTQIATKIAAWAAQEEADATEREEVALVAHEAQAALQAQLDKEAADELREAEKKKPKMHTFNPTKSIGADVIQRPSPYALERLRKFEYVELWYFSPEGCSDAAQSQRSAADDTFGIARSEADVMVLKPVASVRASRKALKDEDLTWDQMEIASNLIIRHQRQLHWPEPATDALAIFWYNLQSHELRSRPNGQRVLLQYQARARREWHAALERKDEGFNISLIDNDLLAKITREIFELDCEATLREVRPIVLLPPLRS